MNITKNARMVLEKRYLNKDEGGNPLEDVEGLFSRVAKAISKAELHFDQNADTSLTEEIFYNMMTSTEFLPNSPTLMNAGKPLGQLSACFVLPIEDTMEGIFDSVKQAALIHKSGGGTGFSFSRLRSLGSTVASTGGVASGPVSFMKVFNAATEAVKQGGTRRGANMGILRIDHPDILSFIDCKMDNNDITNFNISIGVTEKFMEAAFEGQDYELINPKTSQVVGTLNASEVFDKIVDGAWRNGEPGIIFLDRLNRDNVVPNQGEIEATNPCGEQPLLPYESCNLGSINLSLMVKYIDGVATVDFDRIKTVVKNAVHFLDNVIEVNKYPLDKIEEVTKSTRKIGLGVMGFADMLLLLGIPYNSDDGISIARKIMKFINEEGHRVSEELAKIRGPFPLFSESIYKDQPPLRNGTITTIAPTGTISMIANASSGIEPVFAYVYIRNVMDGTEMVEVNPILKQRLISEGLYSEALMKKIAEEGTVAHIDEIPEHIRRVFVSAHDVSPEYHCKMQAAFQDFTDNAVSKTVNFPTEATKKQVKDVFIKAWETGCKGVTIYRDKSRDSQVLNIGSVSGKDATEAMGGCVKCGDDFSEDFRCDILPRPRPEITSGFTERMKIGCGNLYVTVNYDENGICEVFTSTGKAGGCPSQSEATARLVSIAMRSGIKPEEIIYQLKGIRCPSTIRQNDVSCTSCPDAIAKVITKVMNFTNAGGSSNEAVEFASSNIATSSSSNAIRNCPECGSLVEHEGGCVVCRDCGFSKCG